MKIYTKTGDQGETGLLGGCRVSKAHIAVAVTGTIDETNSLLGLARSQLQHAEIDGFLELLQHDLFDLGSRIAACLTESSRAAAFDESKISTLEEMIDQIDSKIPQLQSFILPGGSTGGSTLHLSRSVCRRAERELVLLVEWLANSPDHSSQRLDLELIYLNRLSDLLFVLARFANQLEKHPETLWSVGGSG
ncbi:MAG: cob(I)yrinic acid a,c-diamide adenosyltransferase [Planctomycetota bacterium]